MAFDWSTVDARSMSRRTIQMEEGRSGGVWRQGGEGESCTLETWLREQATWDFDSLMLEVDADAWLTRMENERLVLIRGDVFERAQCGLDGEPGHRHTRYCAGPTAGERRLQRSVARRVAR